MQDVREVETAFGPNVPQRQTAAGDRLQVWRVVTVAGGARLHQTVAAGAHRYGSRELILLLTWVFHPGEFVRSGREAITGPLQKRDMRFLLTPRHARAQKGDEHVIDGIAHDGIRHAPAQRALSRRTVNADANYLGE